MQNKIKVLVLSISPWRIDNSVGNSLSSIFGGMEDKIEFANIYLKGGIPNNSICDRYFQITERLLLKNILKKDKGRIVDKKEGTTKNSITYNFARRKRWLILFLIRELIWKICKWNTQKMDEFIDDFDADLVFLLLNDTIYSNKIAQYVIDRNNAPLVTYIWDDVYGLTNFCAGFFSKIYKKQKRKKMCKLIKCSEILYVISQIQKRDYEEHFGVNCKLLTKGKKFEEMPYAENSNDGVTRLLFTGNIGCGRWKTLEIMSKSINKANEQNLRFTLDIYTATPVDSEIKNAFFGLKGITLNSAITYEKVVELQRKADILVHVEAFGKEKNNVIHSFSTKLVDYFECGKCILAVGPSNVASIYYLLQEDAAKVISEIDNLNEFFEKINKDEIKMYGKKAWECGKRNHSINKIQSQLFRDFEEIINESCTD